MSDTLRAALEELAGQLDRVAKTVAYDGATREVEGLEDLATELRSILAAHPVDATESTVTVYGVKLRSGDVERTGTNILDAEDWLKDMTGGDDPDYEPVGVVTRTTTTSTKRTAWKQVSK